MFLAIKQITDMNKIGYTQYSQFQQKQVRESVKSELIHSVNKGFEKFNQKTKNCDRLNDGPVVQIHE